MIACQIAYYPLGKTEVVSGVREALDIIQGSGLEVQIGPMSTVVSGEASAVYGMLEELTKTMEERGREFVLSVTVSTSCPL